MNALVPTSMSEAMELADIMSKANLLPDHLRGKPGDCLLVVMQAQRWNMDPVSVAQCTSVVRGKLCYEGKLVSAALRSMGAIQDELDFEYSGAGQRRKIVVTGTLRSGKIRSIDGTVEQWATSNDNWKKSPDDMLAYRGTRQWARRWAPAAMLGVYTPDEMEDPEPARATASVVEHAQPAEYPAEDFTRNLPTWRKVIESGRRSAADIIAMAETKGALTVEQKNAIRSCEISDGEVSE
jgi:hypothetical protein